MCWRQKWLDFKSSMRRFHSELRTLPLPDTPGFYPLTAGRCHLHQKAECSWSGAKMRLTKIPVHLLQRMDINLYVVILPVRTACHPDLFLLSTLFIFLVHFHSWQGPVMERMNLCSKSTGSSRRRWETEHRAARDVTRSSSDPTTRSRGQVICQMGCLISMLSTAHHLGPIAFRRL
jgi:hypothetical protein